MKKFPCFLMGLVMVLVAAACNGVVNETPPLATVAPTATLVSTPISEPSIMVLPSWSDGQVFQPGETVTLHWASVNDSKFINVSLYQGEKIVVQDVFLQEKDIPGMVSNVPSGGAYFYRVTIEDTGSYTWEIPASLTPGTYALHVFMLPYPSMLGISPPFVVERVN